jgi:hypothetical protein
MEGTPAGEHLSMKPRLLIAMLCYAVLAVLAGLTLQGLFRAAVWVFLGGLVLRTWIAAARRE